MSGSTAASQIPSLINDLLFIAEMLPICIIQAVRQGDHIGPQQLQPVSEVQSVSHTDFHRVKNLRALLLIFRHNHIH